MRRDGAAAECSHSSALSLKNAYSLGFSLARSPSSSSPLSLCALKRRRQKRSSGLHTAQADLASDHGARLASRQRVFSHWSGAGRFFKALRPSAPSPRVLAVLAPLSLVAPVQRGLLRATGACSGPSDPTTDCNPASADAASRSRARPGPPCVAGRFKLRAVEEIYEGGQWQDVQKWNSYAFAEARAAVAVLLRWLLGCCCRCCCCSSGQAVQDVGHLHVLSLLVVAAQLEDKVLDVRLERLFRHVLHNL